MSQDFHKKQIKPEGRIKTAGEVRFIKDHGDDSNAWAWNQHAPSERRMDPSHRLNKKCSKQIARVLKSTLMSLGHAMTAYAVFAKIKSRDISPDGALGGRGYIMEIKAMRRQYMNIVEALSAISDTIYDEINADHWLEAQTKLVQDVLEEIEGIKEDPEEWAEQQEDMTGLVSKVQSKKKMEQMKKKKKDKDNTGPTERNFAEPRSKTASTIHSFSARRVADRYLAR